MNTKTRGIRFLFVGSLGVAALCGMTVQAGVIVKANNTDALNLTTSWVGGVVPGVNDVATWDNTITTSGMSWNMGSDLSWQGISIVDPVPGNSSSSIITINSGNTLTLGAYGITTLNNQKYYLNNNIVLGTNQSWNVINSQITFAGSLDLGSYSLALTGGGGNRYLRNGTILGAGPITVNVSASGYTRMDQSTSCAPSATLNLMNGIFQIEKGPCSLARTMNLNLMGGSLYVVSVSVDNTETNANAMTICSNAPLSAVRITSANAKSNKIYTGSLLRQVGGTVLFNATSLGVYPISALMSNSANFIVGTAPDWMRGAGGESNTTTCSILPGVLVDTVAGGSGYGVTGGLGTYDSTYGIRLLNPATEYTSAISDGQSQLDNVRLVNASGTILTNTITTDTTINSLSCIVTGTLTSSGIIITNSGSGKLKISSGVIYAMQTATPTNTSNAIVFDGPVLDMNGGEGVVFFYKPSQDSQIGFGGLLKLRSVISNAAGMTFSASGNDGTIDFEGPATNTYSGATVLNSGNMRLFKSGGFNLTIPGDLVINGGSVYLGNGNQIPDTANITINGGSLQFAYSSGSGTGASETFSNLTMYGGSLAYQSGKGQTVGMLGSAYISGTTCAGPVKGNVFVGGSATLTNGAIWTVSRSETANNSYESITTFSNGVTIVNTPSGVYTPISLTAGQAANVSGGKLVLGGALSFLGNSSNTNTATIMATAGVGNLGMIALNGTQVFNIGDGAAAVDVTIVPAITNGATTGGLVKTGAGTLLLTGNNTYGGVTTVSNGTLIVSGLMTGSASVNSNSTLQLDGTAASSITVNGNGLLTGTGTVSSAGAALTVNSGGIVDPGSVGGTGTLTVTGDVSFASGGRLQLDANGGGTDLLTVIGTVTSTVSTVSVTVNAVGNGPWLVMTAANIVPAFTATVPEMVLSKRNNDTELWLYRGVRGTALIIF